MILPPVSLTAGPPACLPALTCLQGRWLLWGWLQERRKMGSYSYAGCLTLPRILHCTEDGRLVQVGGCGRLGWVWEAGLGGAAVCVAVAVVGWAESGCGVCLWRWRWLY